MKKGKLMSEYSKGTAPLQWQVITFLVPVVARKTWLTSINLASLGQITK